MTTTEVVVPKIIAARNNDKNSSISSPTIPNTIQIMCTNWSSPLQAQTMNGCHINVDEDAGEFKFAVQIQDYHTKEEHILTLLYPTETVLQLDLPFGKWNVLR